MCTVVFDLNISPFEKSVDNCVEILKRLFTVSKDYPHRSSLTHLVLSVGKMAGIACGGSIIKWIKKCYIPR